MKHHIISTLSNAIRITVCAVMAMLITPVAQAASIWNVDCVGANAMSGAAVVGSAGDFWNTAETADVDSELVIKDTTGISGPGNIALSFSAPGGVLFGFNADGSANPAALMDGFGTSVNNGTGTSFAPLTFTFSGLVPSTTYAVYAYGASTTGSDIGTHFFQTIGEAPLGSTSGASTDINAGAGEAYSTFAMTTDGAGAFTILTNFNSGSSARAPVNGFQIVGPAPVPEPASICLVAMSGMIVLGLRKRLE
jgi:hypothetical protein